MPIKITCWDIRYACNKLQITSETNVMTLYRSLYFATQCNEIK